MKTQMVLGTKVMLNGYPGKVITVLEGPPQGMVEVRLPGGVCCVDARECQAIPLFE